jgi:hypothetical protein
MAVVRCNKSCIVLGFAAGTSTGTIFCSSRRRRGIGFRLVGFACAERCEDEDMLKEELGKLEEALRDCSGRGKPLELTPEGRNVFY